MNQYLTLLDDVLKNGVRQQNRTGIAARSLPGAMLKFDLRDGFPAVTTKRLAFGQVKGELIGFLRGCTSAADFRALGCTVWDQNANENEKWIASEYRKGDDDLGKLGYSYGWRQFETCDSDGDLVWIDQIARALDALRTDPTSRRILVSAWNPGQLDAAALPPCHVLFQLLPNVESNTLHMTMYQRSADLFLGVPFNIASYALLLELFCAWSGFRPGTLTMFLADCHIYETHVEQVREQLTRDPLPLPLLHIDLPANARALPLDTLLGCLEPDDIRLHEYQSHPAIKAPMAV